MALFGFESNFMLSLGSVISSAKQPSYYINLAVVAPSIGGIIRRL